MEFRRRIHAGPSVGVGENLYRIESSVVAMLHRRCKDVAPLEYLPFLPEVAGRPGVEFALGKGSGVANVEKYLEKRGLIATPDQQRRIAARVRDAGLEKKRLLNTEEAGEIVKSVIGR